MNEDIIVAWGSGNGSGGGKPGGGGKAKPGKAKPGKGRPRAVRTRNVTTTAAFGNRPTGQRAGVVAPRRAGMVQRLRNARRAFNA